MHLVVRPLVHRRGSQGEVHRLLGGTVAVVKSVDCHKDLNLEPSRGVDTALEITVGMCTLDLSLGVADTHSLILGKSGAFQDRAGLT